MSGGVGMQGDRWDLVIVGGGTAGLVASRTAARLGARTLLVESARLGGDCLWTGCVPSKALLGAAGGAAGQSAPSDAEQTDPLAAALTSVRRAIAWIEPVDSAEALEADGVVVRAGQARFVGRDALEVDRERVAFAQAIVCTGAAPRIPPELVVEGLRVRTSDDVWELGALPGRLAVVGGGPMGAELAQAMARLGARVTLVQRAARLLPAEDREASALVQAALERDGVDVRLGRRVEAAHAGTTGDDGELVLDDGSRVPFDVVLAAAGRAPRTAGLGLGAAGVRVGASGAILVDRALRTSAPRIWAAGDVTGPPYLTHVAGSHASTATMNALLGLRRTVDREGVPRATYTSPEVASVGIRPDHADPARHTVHAWHHTHADRAVADDRMDGLTRIVVDRRGRVVGGTIVSPRAGETIAELALAVRAGLTTTTIATTMHPYPTYSDGLWNAAIEDATARLGRGVVGAGLGALRCLRARRLR